CRGMWVSIVQAGSSRFLAALIAGLFEEGEILAFIRSTPFRSVRTSHPRTRVAEERSESVGHYRVSGSHADGCRIQPQPRYPPEHRRLDFGREHQLERTA